MNRFYIISFLIAILWLLVYVMN